jgi:DNA primase
MSTGQETLDRDILPRVFSSLETVFPEFGWRRSRDGWVATNTRYTKERFSARADRVVCRQHSGFLIYGDRGYHWLEYLAGGVFPRGPEWWTVVGALGARVGVALPPPRSSVSQRARALAVLTESLQRGGSAVREYLSSRQSRAPADWLGLLPAEPTEILQAAGFSRGELEATKIKRDGRWVGRVCCEWKDEFGRLRSMWGRTVSEDEPKYLVLAGGSPPLFGAEVAIPAVRRRRPAHGVVVVEGMFDVLSLRAAGLDEVAGVGRAGVTPEGLRALEAVGDATLFLDGDSAGRTGALKSVEEWARRLSPVRLSVADVGAGVKDPDELIGRGGFDAVVEALARRRPAPVAYVEELVRGATTDTEVLAAARRAVPFLAAVGVCHPLEAASATEVLARRGVNAAAMRLLTSQLDVDELQQVKEALTKRLGDVEARLNALKGA